MGSYGGHVLPGSFFIVFGFWYAIKYAVSFLRVQNKSENGGVFYCCRGKIPCSGIVIEGVVKVFMVSIGILIELFYPGAPMGQLHGPDGNFVGPMNWQHATMYFFFGLSGISDIISHTAKHIIPEGTDRIFGGLALFVEGYLFYFHLHGRSNIDTRVHILLVMTVWPSALITFLQCFFMTKRKLLHVLEMLTTTLLIAQGIWFWQVAYILYPPHGEPWDPCMRGGGHSMMMDMHHGDDDHHEDAVDCNDTMETEMNLMFITLFWSWHLALSIFIVCTVYFCVYKMLKRANSLDSRFVRPGYESMLAGSGGKSGRGNGHVRNGLGSSLLTEVDDDEL